MYCIPAKRFAVATTPVSLVGRVARERQLSHHQDDQPANEPVLELPINQVIARAGHESFFSLTRQPVSTCTMHCVNIFCASSTIIINRPRKCFKISMNLFFAPCSLYVDADSEAVAQLW